MHEQYGGGTHGSGTPGLGNVGLSPAAASGNDDGYDGHDDEGGVQPATVGGFLTGVEDVVQPYSLPRPTHVVFSSPPRSPNSNGHSPPPARAGPGTLASSSFTAAATEDDGEERDQQAPQSFLVEDVEELETVNMSGLELEGAQNQSTQRVRRMPKSMAALAAEAEAQANATAADASLVAVTPHKSEGEEAGSTPTQGRRIIRPTTTTRATPRTRANTESKSKSTLTKRTGTRARARAKSKSTTTATATTGTPSRKRERTQDDDDSDDDDKMASGDAGLGSESDSEAEEHVSSGRETGRVAKRARKHRQGSLTDANGDLLISIPPSDRVLRTRKGKSLALLAQEREQELALERALGS
jgi:xeroderma pigmentosum group C-complementing protein